MIAKAIKNYMLLPGEVSEFEQSYLTRMNKVAVGFFALHLPVFVAIAYWNDMGPLSALVLTSFALLGPIFAIKTVESKRIISVVMGVTAMFMGGLLVHFGQGPVQIEMHFYFFVLIALLAVFANPMVVVAAAVTASLHHALLWIAIPQSIFNYYAPFWVVAVHAAFVVLESVAACFIARSFFDNVIGLEKKVAESTAEVDNRNQDMRRILNSVRQGFFTIDAEANISEERSAAVEGLLGSISNSDTFVDVLRRHDGHAADWYELGLEDVFADIMPLDVTLDQLPSRIVANGKTISIASRAIHENEVLTGLAIVLTDISAEVQREKLEECSREMMAVVEHSTKDKMGLISFFEECNDLMESLSKRENCDLVLIKRKIHTLKGNSAIFGLNRLSRACHFIEDYVAENDSLPPEKAWQAVELAWKEASQNIIKIVGNSTLNIEVPKSDLVSLLDRLLDGTPRGELAVEVASWQLEPTSASLSRIADQVRNLAERLGKGDVEVEAVDNELRLDSSEWSEFWSAFIHVIRNAVEHGLETPERRIESGKPQNGRVAIETSIVGDKFVVSISDDGHGIDWDKVAEAAYGKGLPAETQSDLMDAIFADGLSTAEQVTDTSGRGVGMAAVKQSCEDRAGSISVESEAGKGTKFTFRFPLSEMAAKTMKRLGDQQVERPERALRNASIAVKRELIRS